MMFNFWVNQHLFYALASGDTKPLADALRATPRLPDVCQWANFLRNHDELDLGRLTEEQRQTAFARFGPEPHMQLYDRGIRRRLAPMLGGRPQLELAQSLAFSLPGAAVVRYGDEIGMGDDLRLPGRDAVRTPMQWSDERNAGFSLAEKLPHPVIADGVFGYPRINVADQQRDPGSLLNWFRAMIRLRKECPEIGWGDWQILGTGSAHALALEYQWRGNALVIVHNFDERARAGADPTEEPRRGDPGGPTHRRGEPRRRVGAAFDRFGAVRLPMVPRGSAQLRAAAAPPVRIDGVSGCRLPAHNGSAN
jgi:maltose alpha-D-glucosyltransferase/alpha-amylase